MLDLGEMIKRMFKKQLHHIVMLRHWVQKYAELKITAENRMMDRHGQTTSIPGFGLNNLMILQY